jgi:GntR family transcriptional regulator
MLIEISLQDGVPIYRQIVNQFKYLVASGKIRAGDELPPIRTLAEQLSVTPNTIVKAYGELEDEGVIVKRRGAGTYVADLKSPLARKEQRRILEQRADALLTEAIQLNFTYAQVLELLSKRNAIITKSLTTSESKENFNAG